MDGSNYRNVGSIMEYHFLGTALAKEQIPTLVRLQVCGPLIRKIKRIRGVHFFGWRHENESDV